MIEVVDGQRQLNACKRIVVKIGSSLLTANGQGLDLNAISHWSTTLPWCLLSCCLLSGTIR